MDALAYWRQDQRISGKSRETTRTWLSYLRRFGRYCDPMKATHFEVRAWLDENSHWSPSCQKSARNALSSFYRLMKSERWVRRNPMKRVPPAPQRRRVQPRASTEQVRAGLAVDDASVRRMVALAGLCGMRRAEIAQVHTRDLHEGGLRVHGKGDKERWVPLPGWLHEELADVPEAGYLFPGRFERHVHPATVQKRIKGAVGMPPHALRRWFADRVHGEGHDLILLQHLLGHSSPAVTEIYLDVPKDRLRAAAAAALPWAA